MRPATRCLLCDGAAAALQQGRPTGDNRGLRETCRRDLVFHIAVGRRNHPHIYTARALVAESLKFTFLQNAQQFALQLQRDFADFVEKQGAAVGHLNTRDPERVALAYTEDSEWRNRAEFFKGRQAIKEFLRRKWEKELDYHLMKELWAYTDNRISVRFEYEWRDENRQWYRTHGNEHWEFDNNGLMRRRDMSANDYPINESERRII